MAKKKINPTREKADKLLKIKETVRSDLKVAAAQENVSMGELVEVMLKRRKK